MGAMTEAKRARLPVPTYSAQPLGRERRIHMRHTVVMLGAAAVCLALSSVGQAQAPAPFQVMRPGDRTMSCEALIGEINTLNVRVAEIQRARQARVSATTERSRPSAGRAASLGMLGHLGGMIPWGGGRGGALAQGVSTAAEAASQAAADRERQADQDKMSRAATDAAAEAAQTPPEQQRLDRLTRIAKDKNC